MESQNTSKREWFAGMAMVALMGRYSPEQDREWIAYQSVKMSEALVQELKKTQEDESEIQ